MKAKEIIINENVNLFEINMSPRSLRQLASGINAQAGMEFEMVVPARDSDKGGFEKDLGADERCGSIADILAFFSSGNVNSQSELNALEQELQRGYRKWRSFNINQSWKEHIGDHIQDYVIQNDLFDFEEATNTARATIEEEYPEYAPGSSAIERLVDREVVNIEKRFITGIRNQVSNRDKQIYAQAHEDFLNSDFDEYDEIDWFRNESFRYMSDIDRYFDIQWPYMLRSPVALTIQDVGADFEKAIGRPVNLGDSYHGGKREAGKYVVEPDSSIEPDGSSDRGLEFISPPLPVVDMLSDLGKVKAWADANDCYTNESTGLHINVSVPGTATDNLDYVKLVLLLGDLHVLDQFGRLGNSYAKSAMVKLQGRATNKFVDAKPLLDQMRNHLGELAAKSLRTAIDKYTSIHPKEGYIEFRSPGGDWLGENFNLIENTLLRFVVALDAACDPQKYRQEYLTKLYKLLQVKGAQDPIAYFALYSAGELSSAGLKEFIRNIQTNRATTRAKEHRGPWVIIIGDKIVYQFDVSDQREADEFSAKLIADNPYLQGLAKSQKVETVRQNSPRAKELLSKLGR